MLETEQNIGSNNAILFRDYFFWSNIYKTLYVYVYENINIYSVVLLLNIKSIFLIHNITHTHMYVHFSYHWSVSLSILLIMDKLKILTETDHFPSTNIFSVIFSWSLYLMLTLSTIIIYYFTSVFA